MFQRIKELMQCMALFCAGMFVLIGGPTVFYVLIIVLH